GNPADYQPIEVDSKLKVSEALSMANTIKDNIKTRKIAIIAADGVSDKSLNDVKKALLAAGATVEIIAPKLGNIITDKKAALAVDESLLTAASVFYDAVYVPSGKKSVAAIATEPDAVHFLNEAFKHCKAIAIDADAKAVIDATYFAALEKEDGIIIEGDVKKLADQFIKSIAQHRFWDREKARKVPA
ncbi:MAG: catalase HPII, partial [Pedobacter sp.]